MIQKKIILIYLLALIFESQIVLAQEQQKKLLNEEQQSEKICVEYLEEMDQKFSNKMENLLWDSKEEKRLKSCEKKDIFSCKQSLIYSVLLEISQEILLNENLSEEIKKELNKKIFSGRQKCQNLFEVKQNQYSEKECKRQYQFILTSFNKGVFPDFEQGQQQIDQFHQNYDKCQQFALSCQEKLVQETLNQIEILLLEGRYDQDLIEDFFYEKQQQCLEKLVQWLEKRDDLVENQKELVCGQLFKFLENEKKIIYFIEQLYKLGDKQKQFCNSFIQSKKDLVTCQSQTAKIFMPFLVQKGLETKKLGIILTELKNSCKKEINYLEEENKFLVSQCADFELKLASQTSTFMKFFESLENFEQYDCEFLSKQCSKLFIQNMPQNEKSESKLQERILYLSEKCDQMQNKKFNQRLNLFQNSQQQKLESNQCIGSQKTLFQKIFIYAENILENQCQQIEGETLLSLYQQDSKSKIFLLDFKKQVQENEQRNKISSFKIQNKCSILDSNSINTISPKSLKFYYSLDAISETKCSCTIENIIDENTDFINGVYFEIQTQDKHTKINSCIGWIQTQKTPLQKNSEFLVQMKLVSSAFQMEFVAAISFLIIFISFI